MVWYTATPAFQRRERAEAQWRSRNQDRRSPALVYCISPDFQALGQTYGSTADSTLWNTLETHKTLEATHARTHTHKEQSRVKRNTFGVFPLRTCKRIAASDTKSNQTTKTKLMKIASQQVRGRSSNKLGEILQTSKHALLVLPTY
jgi:hypothetical protein